MSRRHAAWLLGGLALAAALWLLPPLAALLQRAAALPAATWALAAAGMAISYALRAGRLRDEWAPRMPLSWPDCLHVTLLHSAAINLLPLRAGELGYPWLLHRRWGVALADAAASLFWLRLQDAAVLAALAWLVFGPDGGLAPGAATALRAASATLCLLVLALAGAPLAARALARLDARIASTVRTPVPHTLAVLPLRVMRHALVAAQHSHGRGWLWTAANWLVKLAVLAMLLHALGGLAPLAAWAGALAGEAAAVLPLQPPAGFGTYEAGVWLGARLGAAQGPLPDAAGVLGAAFTAHLFVIAVSLLAAAASQLVLGAARRQEKPS